MTIAGSARSAMDAATPTMPRAAELPVPARLVVVGKSSYFSSPNQPRMNRQYNQRYKQQRPRDTAIFPFESRCICPIPPSARCRMGQVRFMSLERVGGEQILCLIRANLINAFPVGFDRDPILFGGDLPRVALGIDNLDRRDPGLD